MFPKGYKVTTVRGREGDRRGLFRKAGTLRQPFLTRAVQSLMTAGGKRTPDETRKKRRHGGGVGCSAGQPERRS
jgi:hypothetical protein